MCSLTVSSGGCSELPGLGTQQALNKCLLCDGHIKIHCSLQERQQAWKPRHREAVISLKRVGARSVESALFCSSPFAPQLCDWSGSTIPGNPSCWSPFRWHLSSVPAITTPSCVTSQSALHTAGECSQTEERPEPTEDQPGPHQSNFTHRRQLTTSPS